MALTFPLTLNQTDVDDLAIMVASEADRLAINASELTVFMVYMSGLVLNRLDAGGFGASVSAIVNRNVGGVYDFPAMDPAYVGQITDRGDQLLQRAYHVVGGQIFNLFPYGWEQIGVLYFGDGTSTPTGATTPVYAIPGVVFWS
jgi:hypothetical protein